MSRDIKTEEVYVCVECASEGKMVVFKKHDVRGRSEHTVQDAGIHDVFKHPNYDIFDVPKPVYDGWIGKEVLESCVEAWIEAINQFRQKPDPQKPSFILIENLRGAMSEALILSRAVEP